MRKKTWFVVCVLMLAGVLRAQSPADGAVHGRVYRNTYFKIEFALPAALQAVDFSTLKLGPSNGREFGLIQKKGNDPFGMVLIAETFLGVGQGLYRDEEDFLHRVRIAQHLSETQKTDIYSKSSGAGCSRSFTSSRVGNWTLRLYCASAVTFLFGAAMAQSQTDLDAMLAAIHALHKTT